MDVPMSRDWDGANKSQHIVQMDWLMAISLA
jgi:hypothetical protein